MHYFYLSLNSQVQKPYVFRNSSDWRDEFDIHKHELWISKQGIKNLGITTRIRLEATKTHY